MRNLVPLFSKVRVCANVSCVGDGLWNILLFHIIVCVCVCVCSTQREVQQQMETLRQALDKEHTQRMQAETSLKEVCAPDQCWAHCHSLTHSSFLW